MRINRRVCTGGCLHRTAYAGGGLHMLKFVMGDQYAAPIGADSIVYVIVSTNIMSLAGHFCAPLGALYR